MKEELQEQIEKLHDDPAYMELLEIMSEMDVEEKSFVDSYIEQESPFVEFEPEN